MELGDAVAAALDSVGISKERVAKWLGKPCRCSARQEKLNQLGRWAKRVLSGKTVFAGEYFDRMTDSDPEISTEIANAASNVGINQTDPPDRGTIQFTPTEHTEAVTPRSP
jgi:hypothetical protein